MNSANEAVIRYLGHASFLIISSQQTKIVIDPYESFRWIGYSFPPDVDADIVVITHDHYDHNALAEVKGTPMVVKEPGVQNVHGISFYGILSKHGEVGGAAVHYRNTIFCFNVDRIHFCHLGDLGTLLGEIQLQQLQHIDVLMLPVGGQGHTLDLKYASILVTQLDPRIVVPMHYKIPEMSPNDISLFPVDCWLERTTNIRFLDTDQVMLSKKKLPQKTEIWVFKLFSQSE